MEIHYLEIVTDDVHQVCASHTAAHPVKFSEPNPDLGGARTAPMPGGGLLGVRAPLSEAEQPVIRPYWLVEDLDAAVAKVAASGAMIAHPPLDIPDHGRFAIYIEAGVEQGLWERLPNIHT